MHGKTDDAIEEYRTAIKLNLENAEVLYNLGVMLNSFVARSADSDGVGLLSDGVGLLSDGVGLSKDACAVLMRGAALAPRDTDLPARMKEVDAGLRGAGRCPAG